MRYTTMDVGNIFKSLFGIYKTTKLLMQLLCTNTENTKQVTLQGRELTFLSLLWFVMSKVQKSDKSEGSRLGSSRRGEAAALTALKSSRSLSSLSVPKAAIRCWCCMVPSARGPTDMKGRGMEGWRDGETESEEAFPPNPGLGASSSFFSCCCLFFSSRKKSEINPVKADQLWSILGSGLGRAPKKKKKTWQEIK